MLHALPLTDCMLVPRLHHPVLTHRTQSPLRAIAVLSELSVPEHLRCHMKLIQSKAVRIVRAAVLILTQLLESLQPVAETPDAARAIDVIIQARYHGNHALSHTLGGAVTMSATTFASYAL